MLGKTHVVASLAVVHVGLLGYAAYSSGKDVGVESEPLQVFGFTFGEPMAFAEYGLVVTALLSFVLLLLRVGKRKTLMTYASVVCLGMFGLLVLFDSHYAFELGVMLLCFTLGTLLPDIDSETSTIGRYVTPISRAIPHRTITHTIWVVLLLVILAVVLRSVYVLALALGCAVHIMQDSFSKQGIHWFYPITGLYSSLTGTGARRKISFTYSTGGTGETVLFFAAIVVHVVCIGSVIWSQVA